MPNKPTTLREWEKEFNEKFPTNFDSDWLAYGNICEHDDGYICEHRMAKVKEYIKFLLASHNTELLQKIEGLRNTKKLPDGISKDYREMSDRYDLWTETILNEVIRLINQE